MKRVDIHNKWSGENGSVTLFVMLAVPLMVAMLAIVIDFGRLLVVRARIQAAADLGALAGSAVLADAMTSIARQNWTIHREWRRLEEAYQKQAEQNDNSAQSQLLKFKEAKQNALDTIEYISANMDARSKEKTLAVIGANAPNSTSVAVIYNGTATSLSGDEEAEQNQEPSYDKINGTFHDPSGHEMIQFPPELTYLVKKTASDVSIYTVVTQTIRPMLLQRLGINELTTTTTAAAQAFGGSIRDFALKETDTIEEAEPLMDEGSDSLYHQALIPVWTQGGDLSNFRH